MTDLTLHEKTLYAESRARELVTEKHFYDLAQPFFPRGFSITHRNRGHWDINADQVPGREDAWLVAHGPGSSVNGRTVDSVDPTSPSRSRERAFRVRGEPGSVIVHDERWNPHRDVQREPITFRSVIGAMLWICEELMQEPAAPDVQKDQLA